MHAHAARNSTMKKLTLFLLTSGLALTTLHRYGQRRRRSEQRRQEGAALHRWEEEGGNLPPHPAGRASARDARGV
jgi:hypothetical protein